MADLFNNAFWYTVWDAKTWLKDGRQHVKYICQRELIPRSEVDSLPRKPKRPARVRSTDEPKG